jgi:hypothetical protein
MKSTKIVKAEGTCKALNINDNCNCNIENFNQDSNKLINNSILSSIIECFSFRFISWYLLGIIIIYLVYIYIIKK